MLGMPINSTLSPSGDWMLEGNLNSIYPSIAGYVNYINYHYYNALYDAMTAQNTGQSVYTVSYNDMMSDLTNYLLSGIGNFPIANVIIGEEGITHGETDFGGATLDFTASSQKQYVEAMYDSAQALGIKNLFFFDGFQDYYNSEGQYWYCYHLNGSPVTSKTSVIQAITT